MKNDESKTEGVADVGQQRSVLPPLPNFTLTPKEELAVICQRLRAHIDAASDQTCRVRLGIAHDIIRTVIHRR